MKSACCLAPMMELECLGGKVADVCSKCREVCDEARPDGWCAWHPESGWFGHQQVISNTKEEAWRRLIVHGTVKHLYKNQDEIEKEIRDEGWNIKPVKIVPLDED